MAPARICTYDAHEEEVPQDRISLFHTFERKETRIIMKNCVYCGDYHEENSIYCSKTCSDRTYRFRKSLKEKGEGEIPHIKNDGLKDRWCNFCGATMENEYNLKFCKHEHEADFRESVKRGKPLKIQIDNRTTIQTRKYGRVQELIEAVVTRNAY